METTMKTAPVEVEVVLRVRVDPAAWAQQYGTDLAGVSASVREHFAEHAARARMVALSAGKVEVL